MPSPSHNRTVTVPLRSEESTPDTWVTLPHSAELLRVSVVTTPETLVVTPVKAVAGLSSPERDWGEWNRASSGHFCGASGATPPQGPPASRLPRHRTRLPPAPSRTTALAVPTAEEPAGVVLVVRVAEAADDRPEALVLDHPDGRLTLAMVMVGASLHSATAQLINYKLL